MVVLVTGCRSGFGLLTAVEAGRRGHTVYASLRDVDTADDLIAATEGLDVRPLQLDVTDADDRVAAIARIREEQGRLDALVNNAGIALGGFLEQVTEEEFRRTWEVNVFGLWALTKEALPLMRATEGSTVVNISSMSGRMGLPAMGTYAMSKFALAGMSESWRHELAPFGVRVVLVEPGPYDTDIWTRNRRVAAEAFDPDSPYARFVPKMEAVVDKLSQGQAADPTEVAVKVCDLMAHPRPALRHPIGPNTTLRIWARRILPERVVDAIVQRMLTKGL